MTASKQITQAARTLRHRIQVGGGWLRFGIAAGGLITGLFVQWGAARVNTVAIVYLIVAIVFLLLLRRGPLPRHQLLYFLAADVLAATHAVFAFGASRTMVVAVYVPLQLGYTLMDRRLGLAALCGTVGAYGALLLVEFSNLLPGAIVPDFRSDMLRDPASLIGNWFVFLMVQTGVFWLTRMTMAEAERYADTQHRLSKAEEAVRLATLERKLAESQRLEALGRLACGVAHDFNNILTVILGYGDELQRKFRVDTPGHRHAAELTAAADRAAALTQQLLAFGRAQIANPHVIELNDTIAEVRRMLRRVVSEDIVIRMSLDAERTQVEIDPTHMQQVVTNLVVNARDAMPDGGLVEIRTQDGDPSDPWLRPPQEMAADQCVVLSVRDTGTGMDEGTLARVFEPFFTTKDVKHGTGLGLSMAYGTIRQAGGAIKVQSTPGEGTTFWIWLPLATRRLTEAIDSLLEAPRGQGTILLAEDEVGVRRLATEILSSHGYRVIEASDGTEALSICEGGEPFDLLLTDIVMPGMSGTELATRLRDKRPDAGVLFMTGYAPEDVLTRCALTDTATILRKPFGPAQLLAAVRNTLHVSNQRVGAG